MLQLLDFFAGVGVKDLGLKVISMGCDNNNIFQDAKTGVITKMKKPIVPFMIEVYCFVQQTNLVMLVLLNFNLAAQLEMLLQAMYVFFFHSLKKFLEFQKLFDVFIEKGNKLFTNVKMKCVME
jgi:hypothetical protein